MVAGEFDKEVRLWKPTQTNTDGVVSTVDTLVHEPWASVLPQTGREYYRAKQVHATMTHLVRIYYSPEVSPVKPTWWLTLGGRRLNIVAVSNVEENDEFFDLVCVEVIDA